MSKKIVARDASVSVDVASVLASLESQLAALKASIPSAPAAAPAQEQKAAPAKARKVKSKPEQEQIQWTEDSARAELDRLYPRAALKTQGFTAWTDPYILFMDDAGSLHNRAGAIVKDSLARDVLGIRMLPARSTTHVVYTQAEQRSRRIARAERKRMQSAPAPVASAPAQEQNAAASAPKMRAGGIIKDGMISLSLLEEMRSVLGAKRTLAMLLDTFSESAA